MKYEPDKFITNFSLALRSSEGWVDSKVGFFITFFRLFFPYEVKLLSGSLGIGFVVIFFFPIFKKYKDFYFLILISSLLVMATGQLLPRYFLESYLVLAYFAARSENLLCMKYLKGIILMQTFVIFLLSLSFIVISLNYLYPFTSKEKYLSKFAYTYYNSKQVKNLKLHGNILDLEIARETLFFPDNLYPARNINMWKDKEMQKTVLLDFLNK